MFVCLQIPGVGFTWLLVPLVISAFVAVLAAQMHLTIIFMEGGVGKNGSTVAVSTMWFPLLLFPSVLPRQVALSSPNPLSLICLTSICTLPSLLTISSNLRLIKTILQDHTFCFYQCNCKQKLFINDTKWKEAQLGAVRGPTICMDHL